MLKEDERTRLAQNIAGHVKDAKPFIQERTVSVPFFSGFFSLSSLTLSLPKANLTKPRKLLNPELSNET